MQKGVRIVKGFFKMTMCLTLFCSILGFTTSTLADNNVPIVPTELPYEN